MLGHQRHLGKWILTSLEQPGCTFMAPIVYMRRLYERDVAPDF